MLMVKYELVISFWLEMSVINLLLVNLIEIGKVMVVEDMLLINVYMIVEFDVLLLGLWIDELGSVVDVFVD